MIGLKIKDSEGNEFTICDVPDRGDEVTLRGKAGTKFIAAFELLYYSVVKEESPSEKDTLR